MTAVSVPGGEGIIIDRGEGPYIWDTTGRRYLDLLMGSGAAVLGHAYPEVVDAIERQARRGTTFYALTAPALALAERIVGHYPGAEALSYCSSGSEATFFALRLARAATGRQKVLKFEGGFHGSNDYALMSAFPVGPPNYPMPEPSSMGIPSAIANDVLIAPYNDIAWCRKVVEETGDQLAAIIVEPYQRNIAPEAGFLAALRDLATTCGACLIFDEVVTGFRLGLGGAAAFCGVTPDLATLGKAIGGGLPLAAIVGTSNIMTLASPQLSLAEGFVYCTGTLSGNPLAAAAGLATMTVLEQPSTFPLLFSVGEELRTRVTASFERRGIDVEVLGIGPMFQICLTSSSIVDYRSAASADMRAMQRIASRMLEHKVYYTGAKGYLSLSHNSQHVERVLTVLEAVLGSSIRPFD
jgi:glutamate-1-semialdehyde 2,1-aminomutase